jgi:hypothetical protein
LLIFFTSLLTPFQDKGRSGGEELG